ncbi:hypothetical protein TVAG_443120 [Trichomonas vaginalis G3]|uniref:Uncharacterized protein n=1 Tax=Trichomonas vaginalis (strain ATCC PRA-98 / G3) TaxID=412133 RepID=A2FIR4_TRIV3|nr:hypothetical protein TVAGG3_0389060 [Trichomonas vaginalis G3]EAX95200.1 hypothetical protein TVAG_443120 [Trichomonas vaginalis G3]KAI5533858.1 hypothetical protein TVAGG3_0389060 [Trichomonas vaginalis G3]|eukprot:XP_001308130.1 hypothetical protein [Trichomonas vaginalis G3]
MLYDWVHKWTPIVSKVSSIGSTCMNEAFNSKIACYLDKSRAWKNINIRVNVAILEWNDPEHFLGDIQKALHLPPLPKDCVKSFEENCYSKMILKQKLLQKVLKNRTNTKNPFRVYQEEIIKFSSPNGNQKTKTLMTLINENYILFIVFVFN